MAAAEGGNTQTCAACKYQRRRCPADCLLAPYFPADQPEEFRKAHQLFGLSNITKILKIVPTCQRDDAMKSIKYESDMRARFPVYGCVYPILVLDQQLKSCQNDLIFVNSLLDLVRHQDNYYLPDDMMMNDGRFGDLVNGFDPHSQGNPGHGR